MTTDFGGIITQLRAEKARLEIAISALEELAPLPNRRATDNHAGSIISAEGKARIAAASRARWAKVRAAKAAQPVVRGAGISVKAQERIAAAQGKSTGTGKRSRPKRKAAKKA